MKKILYRIKWFLARFINFDGPIHVDIELNTSCNQKCVSCWHSEVPPPFTISSMSEENAFSFIRQARELGALSVKFNLRGDPLLSPILLKCIDYARQLGFIDIMINTNGIYLSRYAIELNAVGLTTLIISVDASTPATYAKIHNCNPGEFNILIDNIIFLRKLYRNGLLKYTVKLNWHRNQYNKDESMELWTNNFPMFPLVVRDTMPRRGTDISIANGTKKRRRKCPHIMRRLTVTTTGKVYPCCVCYNEPNDICLGTLPLKYAWDGWKRGELLDDYLLGVYTESCLNCTSGDVWN